MSARFDPSEKQIADLLERFTPRQLAIGYLRAQRRAQREAAQTEIMNDIDDWLRKATRGETGAKHPFRNAQPGFPMGGRAPE